MVLSQVVDQILDGTYHPLAYWSHLSKEEKQVIKEEVIPRLNKRSLPTPLVFYNLHKNTRKDERLIRERLKVPGRGYVDGDIVGFDLFAYLRGTLFRKEYYNGQLLDFLKLVDDTSGEGTVCSDYHDIVRFIPMEAWQRSENIELMINGFMKIPFESTSSYAVFLDAYGAILASLGIYEITTAYRALFTTLNSLQEYLRIRQSSFNWEASPMKPIYLEKICEMTKLDFLSSAEKDPKLFKSVLCAIITFYLFQGRKEQQVWNSYPMECLKRRLNEPKLYDYFKSAYLSLHKGIWPYVNMEDSIHHQQPALILPPKKAERYEELRKKFAEAMKLHTNGLMSDTQINFDIDENRLGMYMVRYNDKHPIRLLPNYQDGITIYSDGDYYMLFTIDSDDVDVYAGRLDKADNDEDLVTILQFTGSKYRKYVFEYDIHKEIEGGDDE